MPAWWTRTSVVVATYLAVGEWPTVSGDANMAMTLLERLAQRCNIVETGKASWRSKDRS